LSDNKDTLIIQGSDEWKEKLSPLMQQIDVYFLYEVKPLPIQYAVEEEDGICSYKHCANICPGQYQFSDGCGPTYQDRAYVYHTKDGSKEALNEGK
jgi:hypothetical protein